RTQASGGTQIVRPAPAARPGSRRRPPTPARSPGQGAAKRASAPSGAAGVTECDGRLQVRRRRRPHPPDDAAGGEASERGVATGRGPARGVRGGGGGGSQDRRIRQLARPEPTELLVKQKSAAGLEGVGPDEHAPAEPRVVADEPAVARPATRPGGELARGPR